MSEFLPWISLAFSVLASLVAVISVLFAWAERETVRKLQDKVDCLDAQNKLYCQALEGWHKWYRQHANGGHSLPEPPEPVELDQMTDDGKMSL